MYSQMNMQVHNTGIHTHRVFMKALDSFPDSKVHEAYIGPTWGRHDLGGPHVGPMNLALRVGSFTLLINTNTESVLKSYMVHYLFKIHSLTIRSLWKFYLIWGTITNATWHETICKNSHIENFHVAKTDNIMIKRGLFRIFEVDKNADENVVTHCIFENWVKVQLWGPELFKKRGHYIFMPSWTC